MEIRILRGAEVRDLLPMAECLARCVIDFGGRPYLVWRGMDELAFKQIPGLTKPKRLKGWKRWRTKN